MPRLLLVGDREPVESALHEQQPGATLMRGESDVDQRLTTWNGLRAGFAAIRKTKRLGASTNSITEWKSPCSVQRNSIGRRGDVDADFDLLNRHAGPEA